MAPKRTSGGARRPTPKYTGGVGTAVTSKPGGPMKVVTGRPSPMAKPGARKRPS